MSRMERKEQEVTKRTKGRKARFEEKFNEQEGAGRAAAKAKKENRFVKWFKGLKTWKKVALIAGVVFLVLAIVAGAATYYYFNMVFEEVHEETPVHYDLSLVDVDGYYNILLLGVDSRDMDNLKGTRSDAIMIVSINKDTNDVKILSVYRDTYLKLGDTYTYDKITHACVYGGPEMTIKSLNQALDLNISNYVVVNFKAVADLVDAVGGIEVDVQDFEIEQLNKYTKETAYNIGRNNFQLVEAPGLQKLDGCQAVSYSRIRKGVGDDFKRTERMRTVVSLTMNKMKKMDFNDIKGIIKMMTPQVQTNLSKKNILGLAFRLPQYNIIGTTGWPYNVFVGSINNISYVFPSTLATNTEQMHHEFFGREDYTATSKVHSISSEIIRRLEEARQKEELENEQELEIDTSQEGDKKEEGDKDKDPNDTDDTKDPGKNEGEEGSGESGDSNGSGKPEGEDKPEGGNSGSQTPGTGEGDQGNEDSGTGGNGNQGNNGQGGGNQGGTSGGDNTTGGNTTGNSGNTSANIN